MADAGFFKGTTSDQDNRFADKKKKLIKSMKFGEHVDTKIDMAKVNLDTIKPWINQKITDLLGFEDDVVIEFVYNQLEERHPDGRDVQINMTGFLNGRNARVFIDELWQLLASAQNSAGGVPPKFVEIKMEELKRKQAESDRIKDNLKRKEAEISMCIGVDKNNPETMQGDETGAAAILTSMEKQEDISSLNGHSLMNKKVETHVEALSKDDRKASHEQRKDRSRSREPRSRSRDRRSRSRGRRHSRSRDRLSRSRSRERRRSSMSRPQRRSPWRGDRYRRGSPPRRPYTAKDRRRSPHYETKRSIRRRSSLSTSRSPTNKTEGADSTDETNVQPKKRTYRRARSDSSSDDEVQKKTFRRSRTPTHRRSPHRRSSPRRSSPYSSRERPRSRERNRRRSPPRRSPPRRHSPSPRRRESLRERRYRGERTEQTFSPDRSRQLKEALSDEKRNVKLKRKNNDSSDEAEFTANVNARIDERIELGSAERSRKNSRDRNIAFSAGSYETGQSSTGMQPSEKRLRRRSSTPSASPEGRERVKSLDVQSKREEDDEDRMGKIVHKRLGSAFSKSPSPNRAFAMMTEMAQPRPRSRSSASDASMDEKKKKKKDKKTKKEKKKKHKKEKKKKAHEDFSDGERRPDEKLEAELREKALRSLKKRKESCSPGT